VRGAPVDDTTFQRFLSLHAYDKTDLEARVERVDDTSPYWRRETVSFRAAYDHQRVLAHLFLPKSAVPPYQLVAFLDGAPIHNWRGVEDMLSNYQFIVKTGRAVVIPVFGGTLERGPSQLRLPLNQERERDLEWSKDLGRTLDYLEHGATSTCRRLGSPATAPGRRTAFD
jgi:hypothetical protein